MGVQCSLGCNSKTRPPLALTQGSHIEVRSSNRKGMLVIEVQDNGIGISSDVRACPYLASRCCCCSDKARQVMKTIFAPFQQGDDVTGTCGGLGLGLSLVKGIAELHGGTVQVYSEGAASDLASACR